MRLNDHELAEYVLVGRGFSARSLHLLCAPAHSAAVAICTARRLISAVISRIARRLAHGQRAYSCRNAPTARLRAVFSFLKTALSHMEAKPFLHLRLPEYRSCKCLQPHFSFGSWRSFVRPYDASRRCFHE